MEVNGIRLPDDIAAVVDTPIWRFGHSPQQLNAAFPGVGNLREGQLFSHKSMLFEANYEYGEEIEKEVRLSRFMTGGEEFRDGWVNIDKSVLIGSFFMEDSLMALEMSPAVGPRISYLVDDRWLVAFETTGSFIEFLRLNPPL